MTQFGTIGVGISMGRLIFIGPTSHALNGNGKASADFWRYAIPIFKSYHIEVCTFRSVENFNNARTADRCNVYVLIYNEDEGLDIFDRIEELEQSINSFDPSALIINSHKIGRVLGDKTRSSIYLTSRGVSMPKLIEDSANQQITVFSNVNRGSGLEPIVSPASTTRQGAQFFNTEYIDTTHSFRGRDYFVSLRSMCVGKICVATYVRCRPVIEQSPSVHTKNTPLDADLLNFFHVNIVLKRQEQIAKICSKIGNALGPGFYSHDILPLSSSNEVFLCESGFKFDEDTYARRFEPLKEKLLFCTPFCGRETQLMAHAFVAEMRALKQLG